MDNPFYSIEELNKLGLRVAERAKDVHISRFCRLYGVEGECGDHVRIDDFSILKGNIHIGNHVHIASFCLVAGTGDRITLQDFSTLAAYTAVYTGSDDYSSSHLHSSTVPAKYKNVITGPVVIEKGALIGAHCVIMPKVRVGAYASVGAMQIVYKDVPEGEIRTLNGVKGRRDIKAMKKLADGCQREMAKSK